MSDCRRCLRRERYIDVMCITAGGARSVAEGTFTFPPQMHVIWEVPLASTASSLAEIGNFQAS
eukprot:4226001-Amphidinium_carterae.1